MEKKKRYRRILSWILSATILITGIPVNASELALTPGSMETADKAFLETELVQNSSETVVELEEMRDENRKYYRMPDGSFTAVMYDAPVHFQDNKGEWKDIDNSLVKEQTPVCISDSMDDISNDRYSVRPKQVYVNRNGKVVKSFASDLSSGFLFGEWYGDTGVVFFLENRKKSEESRDKNESVKLENQISKNAEIILKKNQDSIPKMEPVAEESSFGIECAFIEVKPNENSTEQTSGEQSSGNESTSAEIQTGQEEELYIETADPGDLSFYTNAVEAKISKTPALSKEDRKKDTIEILSNPEKLTSSLEYAEVFEDTDFHYESYSNHIKESILVKKQQKEYCYSFIFTAANLRVAEEKDGSFILEDIRSGKETYRILSPYMCDASGEISYDVSYELKEIKDADPEDESVSYRLVVTADPDWINSTERTFPVTIDPTLELASGNSVDDITSTYVIEGTPTTAQSGYRSIYVGYGAKSTRKQHNAYVHVNTLPVIPENCIPVSASLSYYNPSSQGWSAVGIDKLNLECHELIPSTTPSNYVSWIRNLTWNTKPAHSGSVLDYVTMSADTVETYVSFDVTEAAKKWYSDPGSNKGLAIIPAAFSYGSSKAALAVLQGYGATYPSRFMVTYRNMVGMEEYYTGREESIDRAGEAYISDYTGELTLSHEDMEWESVCNALTLFHVYNSAYGAHQFTADSEAGITTRDYTSMKMGAGWKLSLQQTLVNINVDENTKWLVWNDADGTEHYFHRKAGYGTIYEDEDGLNLTIRKTYPEGPAVFYSMTDEDSQHTWEFYNGYLSAIRDSNGNAIEIAYNRPYNAQTTDWKPVYNVSTNYIRQIVSVPNGSPSTVLADLSYNGGYLSSITDYRGDVTTFTYSEGNLTRITYPSGQSVSYTYDSAVGKMTSATDHESGYGMTFSYADRGFGKTGVSLVREYAMSGQNRVYGNGYRMGKASGQLSYTRYFGPDHASDSEQNSTLSDDTILYTSFDYGARTINCYETDNNGQILGVELASYTPETGSTSKSNRITQVSSMGIHGTNLLQNSGAEETSRETWTFAGTGSGVTGGTAQSIPAQNRSGASITMKPRTGGRMLWVKMTEDATSAGNGTVYRNVSLQAGRTYTLSGYINTMGAAASEESASDRGAGMFFADASGTILSDGERIDYSTSESIEDGWERCSVSFTPAASGSYRVGLYAGAMSGDICADDLQLEEGMAPTSANLLQDGSFESGGLTWWSAESSTQSRTTGIMSGTAAQVSAGALHGDAYGLALQGAPACTNTVSQTVNVSCSGETTFLLSGWAKADAVWNDASRKYGLTATIRYSDGTTEDHEAAFNTDYSGWQYISSQVVPKTPEKTISFIVVTIHYDHQTGNASFDQIVLHREPVQTYRYDADGNLTDAKHGKDAKTAYEYFSGTHLLKSYTDEEGVTTSLTYEDTTHNILTSTSGGVQVSNTYTGSQSAGYGNGARTGAVYKSTTRGTSGEKYLETSSLYTADNERLAKAVDGNNITTSYEYQDYRLKNKQTGSLDAVEYTYDSITGYPSRITSGSGETQTSLTEHYANGFADSVTRETGSSTGTICQKYSYGRDLFGNLTGISVSRETVGGSMSDPLMLASYQYESGVNNGRLSRVTYANGDHTSYLYDQLGRLIQETDSDGETIHYRYNSDDELAEKYVTDLDGSVTESYTYSYDSLGRTIHTRQTDGSSMLQRTEHIYDTADRLTSQSWQFGDKSYQEGYAYDANGNLNLFTPAMGSTLNYQYDSLNRLYRISGETYTKEYTYRDLEGDRTSLQVSGLRYTYSGGSTDLSYSYDGNGNLTQTTNGNSTLSYTYDGKGQLTGVTGGGITESYCYDGAGNLISAARRNVEGGTTSHNYSYEYPKWADLLTAYDGKKIAYEGQTYQSSSNTVTGTAVSGNPVSYYNGTRYAFSWRKGTQLKSVQSDGKDIHYVYDLDGVRKQKTVNGQTWNYLLLNGQIARVTSGNRILDIIYDNNGDPYGINDSSDGGKTYTEYYYLKNMQGDVIGLLDGNGNIAAMYTYDVWGKPVEVLDGNGSPAAVDCIARRNPLRYRGYCYDEETGFYYVSSRYYDPEVGRFISADTTDILFEDEDNLLQYNLYSYCFNNPANMIDFTGESPSQIIGAIAGGIGGYALGKLLAKELGLKGAKRKALIAVATLGGAALGAFLGPYIAKLGRRAFNAVKAYGKKIGSKKVAQGACFVEGTPISTKDGDIPIEVIKVGDLVYSENPETGEKGLKQVVRTFENQTDELIHVFVENEEIITTPEHPFYVPKKGWVSSVQLRAGDILLLQSGEYIIVEKIQYEILESPIEVYNFEVADYHTYYVGDERILVHNMCQQLLNVYKSIKQAPGYNKNFVQARNGLKKVTVNNKQLLQQLNQVGSGWKKVYQNAWINGQKVSLHYFKDSAGRIFDFKIKYGRWS